MEVTNLGFLPPRDSLRLFSTIRIYAVPQFQDTQLRLMLTLKRRHFSKTSEYTKLHG
jgi:hypothetical protein